MTIRELLLQEINSTTDQQLENVLSFLKSLKKDPTHSFVSYRELLDRIDYLEAIVGIRKGLDEFDQGQGIPAQEALETLQHKLNIPPRP
jgi:hypothetical protein